MRSVEFIALIAAATFATAANAQNQCSSYVGQVIAPQTFDAATAAFSSLKPKDEFETTAQYESRKAAAVSSIASPAIISISQSREDNVLYDADTQKLRIMTGAFSSGGFYASDALPSAGLGNIPVTQFDNFDAVVMQTNAPTGSYTASNSFGATTTVIKMQRVSKVIFDRKQPDVFGNDLFPTAARNALSGIDRRTAPRRYVVGEIPMSPNEARSMKENLKFAFVVKPKEPYFVKGSHRVGATTIQNPNEVTEDFSILFADFQCGLVADGFNKVLGAYPMKQM